jgi:hypothetical protein
MTKSKDINDPTSITAYIQKLDPEFAEMLEAIRQVILSTDKTIGEQIKWNSPSFFYMGEMKPFNPKEYKRDIVVVNTRNGVALLVFPTGATIKDTTGILEGEYKDGRRMVTFKSIAEVKKKGKDLQKIIKAWLKLVDK